jgi:hypothetical protein
MGAFDSANVALVAYAEVFGDTGASTGTNSGITTTRTSLGRYVAILPSGLTQSGYRDLIFVQPKLASGVALNGLVRSAKVIDDLDATKVIEIVSATTAVDCDFSIMIWRTQVPPPSGSPA